jgi:hypothetical protein
MFFSPACANIIVIYLSSNSSLIGSRLSKGHFKRRRCFIDVDNITNDCLNFSSSPIICVVPVMGFEMNRTLNRAAAGRVCSCVAS